MIIEGIIENLAASARSARRKALLNCIEDSHGECFADQDSSKSYEYSLLY